MLKAEPLSLRSRFRQEIGWNVVATAFAHGGVGATGAAVTVLLLMGSPWLSAAVLKAPQLELPLALAASAILFSIMNVYQFGALAGLEEFRALARASIVQGFIHVAMCTAAAPLWGLTGALLRPVVSAGARWCVFSITLPALWFGNAMLAQQVNGFSQLAL